MVTLEQIEGAIEHQYFFTGEQGAWAAAGTAAEIAGRARSGATEQPLHPGLHQLTFCVLVLRNGHKVVGINHGSVDPANHDPVAGRRMARLHAIDQCWEVLGLLRREQLSASPLLTVPSLGD